MSFERERAEREELERRARRLPFRVDYDDRGCLRCGVTISAPPSRIGWVFRMHVERCEVATPEERRAFRRTGRWPRKVRNVDAARPRATGGGPRSGDGI